MKEGTWMQSWGVPIMKELGRESGSIKLCWGGRKGAWMFDAMIRTVRGEMAKDCVL